jgi:hypothetical protein
MPDEFNMFDEFNHREQTPLSSSTLLDRIQKDKISRENYLYIHNEDLYYKWAHYGPYWFYLVAALTLVNCFFYIIGENIGLFFGLGISHIIEEITYFLSLEMSLVAGREIMLIGFIINLVLIILTILIGYWSSKQHRRIYLFGTIMYGIDLLLCLIFGYFLYTAFHAFGLFVLIRSNNSLSKLNEPPAVKPIQHP